MSDNFHNFCKLPAEIRNMIWSYSLPDSRVYEILDAPHATAKTPPHQGLMFANVHPEPPPALAAVCRESRYFVLHHYKPLTLGKTTKYVDLSRDILLLEPYLLVKRLHRTLNFMAQIPLVREGITRLALGTSYGVYTGICHPVLNWKVSKGNVAKLLGSLARFEKLRTLVFVVHQEFQFEFDCGGRLPTYAASPAMPVPGQDMQVSAAAPMRQGQAPLQPGPTSQLPLFMADSRLGMSTPGPLPLPNSVGRGVVPTYVHQHLQQQHLQRPPPTSPQSHHYLHPYYPPVYNTHHSHPLTAQYPPPSPPAPRPQQVHQAYRFKFDVEANINHSPRGRPHVNELLYYPLDYDPGSLDGEEDWDLLEGEEGLGDEEEDEAEEEGEWWDPWPTNDDWRRFRRRFVRAVRGVVRGMRAANGRAGVDGDGEGCGRGGAGGSGGGSGGGKRKRLEREDGRERGGREETEPKRRKICVPQLKGASLLWRYTKGGYA